jgi:N-acetylglutamate synthase-like GNAT family acetyltransferase
VEIRRASVADLPALRALVREAYAPYVPRIGREPAPMTADYAALVEAAEVWVATDDRGVAGVLVLHSQADALFLENVAVAPAAQGRGIGRALIAHAERRARELGLAEVTLYTNAKMTENLALYPALGYVETDRRREDGYDRVFYRKPVA